jgi:two-component system OmpR family response regulator
MRVLVVEDEVRTAALLRRGLSEEGYAVDMAADGPDGVWRATEFSYDVVVLDVMLPGFDGFEVCRKLRGAGCWAPVLMLTARSGLAERVRGLDCGADDYLAKPFSFDELFARLRALIRRGAPERPAVVEVGDLRLDPATRRAWRGETELRLSPKEFALLELFLRSPDQVLTRTRILEHAWDYAYDGGSNVVDQYAWPTFGARFSAWLAQSSIRLAKRARRRCCPRRSCRGPRTGGSRPPRCSRVSRCRYGSRRAKFGGRGSRSSPWWGQPPVSRMRRRRASG